MLDQDVRPTTNVGEALDRIGITRAHKIILLLVLAGGFFDVFEQNGAAVTGPSLKALWGLSTTQVGFIATVTFLSMVVGGLATGVLADRAGRKTLFTFNLAIYSAGGLLCAFAPNYEVLLIGRVIVGLGLGGELTIALPFLTELMPTKFRGTAVSLFNLGAGGLGNPISFVFGALIIGVFGPYLGGLEGSWRWYFGLLALPALLILYIRRHLPETPAFLVSKGKIDEANRALSTLASGHLNPKHVDVTEHLAPETAAVTVPGTELDGRRSLKRDVHDIFHGQLLRNTTTVGISGFMSFGGQIGVLTLMPLILIERGYSITNSLSFTAVMQGGALAGTIAAAFLNHRFPRRAVVIPCALLAGTFGVLFALLGVTIPTILLFGFFFNFFVLICNTTIWAWAPELYPTRVRATGTGIVVNSGLLGQAIMPLVAAFIFTNAGLYAMFAVVAGMYVTVAALVIFAPETYGRDLQELHGEL